MQANQNAIWSEMTVEALAQKIPIAVNSAVLERFLNDINQEMNNTSLNMPSGMDMRYPQELLSDKTFVAIMANLEFYSIGYAQGMQEGYIGDLKESGEMELAASAEKDLSIIEQMPDFYETIKNEYINDFKKEDPAFQDVEIPFFHPPMPDYFLDVVHNGKTIEAECLDHQTVQATQFCLMKDPADKSNPFFTMSYRIDKIDDTASYAIQNLKAKSLSDARRMFGDVVAGREPKAMSIHDKLTDAISKTINRNNLHDPNKQIKQHTI